MGSGIVGKIEGAAAVVGGGEAGGRIVIERDASQGAVEDGLQMAVGAEDVGGVGAGSGEDVRAGGGEGEDVGSGGDGEIGNGERRTGSETIDAAGAAAEGQGAIGIGGESFAEIEGPADAEWAGGLGVGIVGALEEKAGAGPP